MFNIDLNSNAFKGNLIWSNRIENVFKEQGNNWSKDVEKKVKQIVKSKAILSDNIFHSSKIDVINSLVIALEKQLSNH